MPFTKLADRPHGCAKPMLRDDMSSLVKGDEWQCDVCGKKYRVTDANFLGFRWSLIHEIHAITSGEPLTWCGLKREGVFVTFPAIAGSSQMTCPTCKNIGKDSGF